MRLIVVPDNKNNYLKGLYREELPENMPYVSGSFLYFFLDYHRFLFDGIQEELRIYVSTDEVSENHLYERFSSLEELEALESFKPLEQEFTIVLPWFTFINIGSIESLFENEELKIADNSLFKSGEMYFGQVDFEGLTVPYKAEVGDVTWSINERNDLISLNRDILNIFANSGPTQPKSQSSNSEIHGKPRLNDTILTSSEVTAPAYCYQSDIKDSIVTPGSLILGSEIYGCKVINSIIINSKTTSCEFINSIVIGSKVYNLKARNTTLPEGTIVSAE